MRALLNDFVLAESDDIVTRDGYAYFPAPSVKVDRLEKAPRTTSDLACPHGVQFYNVIVDGERHTRSAWMYESPRPEMAEVRGRFGFWEDVKVA